MLRCVASPFDTPTFRMKLAPLSSRIGYLFSSIRGDRRLSWDMMYLWGEYRRFGGAFASLFNVEIILGDGFFAK